MNVTGSNSLMERFEIQKQILKNGNYFKLVCGAGNEDPNEIYKLCLVYTLAGTLGIDLSAKTEVVLSAKKAIDDAEKLVTKFGIRNFIRPFLTVSVGMSGDPHVRKAIILKESCTECNACIPVCPTEAIPKELVVSASRCIGCGACQVACQDDAVIFKHNEIDMLKTLYECIEAGAENIELHAAIANHETTLIEWNLVAKVLQKGFISVCLDRGNLSNAELKKRIELMLEVAQGRMIVQADGIPMSGGKDDYNTTLQAIATADIVAKTKLPVFILISGGTNSKSAELSKLCDVSFAGVSIGTFARHSVYKFINDPNFPNNGLLEAAVNVARELVSTCYVIT